MSYNELNPERAILLCDFRDSYDEVYGSEIFVDGNMEAAGTAAWASTSASLAKTSYLPHSGSQAMRVTYTGAGAGAGYMRQNSTQTIGKRYRISGWTRGNGNANLPRLMDSAVIWAGVASTSWQYFQVDFTAGGTFTNFRMDALATNEWQDWDDLSIYELRRVTRNYGTYPGAPATIQLGDGYTSTTFPTQLRPRGFRFDGGDWIDAGQAGATLTDNFTMYCCHNQTDLRANRAFISRHDGVNVQYTWYRASASGAVGLSNGSSVRFGSMDQRLSRNCVVSACTISGGYVTHYLNGAQDGTVGVALVLTQRVANTVIGKVSAAGSYPFIGPIYSVALFPAPHTAEVVKEMSRRMLQGKMIP